MYCNHFSWAYTIFKFRGPYRQTRLYIYTILVLFIGADLGSGIYRAIKSHGTNTSIGAHLGGAIVGLTLGLAILYNFDLKPWETTCKWVGVAVFCVAALFAIFWNAFWPGFEHWDTVSPPCDYFSKCEWASESCSG